MTIETIIPWFAAAAILLGAIECFAGFKIMKIMIAAWGLFGGVLAGFCMGISTDYALLGILISLIISTGIAILILWKYKISVSVLVGFLSGMAIYFIFNNIFFAILAGIVFSALVWSYKKDVAIITTAISGAGIILMSAYILMGIPIRNFPVVTAVLWIPIALVGIGCQYLTIYLGNKEILIDTNKISIEGKEFSIGNKETRSNSKQAVYEEKNKPRTIKEKRPVKKTHTPRKKIPDKKTPGTQKRCRNFCIKCGNTIDANTLKCSRCGFDFND